MHLATNRTKVYAKLVVQNRYHLCDDDQLNVPHQIVKHGMKWWCKRGGIGEGGGQVCERRKCEQVVVAISTGKKLSNLESFLKFKIA